MIKNNSHYRSTSQQKTDNALLPHRDPLFNKKQICHRENEENNDQISSTKLLIGDL
jgi:hypothetical protein